MRRPRVVVSLPRRAALGRVLGVVSLALVAALSGCGNEPASSNVDYSKLGVPMPSPDGPYKTPEPNGKAPGDDANPSQQILYDLRERVVRTAGVEADTEAECAGGVITGTVDQTVSCTVTYRGLTVRYDVQITGGNPTFSWVATTERSVLTAEGVGLAYWAKYGAGATSVRCDKMPEQRLIEIDKATDFRCYHKSGDGWQEHAVVLRDGGIKFNTVEPE